MYNAISSYNLLYTVYTLHKHIFAAENILHVVMKEWFTVCVCRQLDFEI